MIGLPILPHPVVAPFVSVRRIVIPSASPTNVASGTNSTLTSFPLAVTLYFPCPGTT